MQQKNQLLFFVLAFLFLIGYFSLRNKLFPPPPRPDVVAEDNAKDEGAKKDEGPKKDEAAKKEEVAKKPAAPAAGKTPEPRPVTPDGQLITLGSADPESPFHMKFVLDPLGAAVRSATLNKFRQADDHGRPLPTPLELVPDEANRWQPSFLLLHFDVNDPNAVQPLDTLGRVRWDIVEQKTDGGDQSVSFRAEVQGVRVTKTFTLSQREYHVGLKVQVERAPGAKDRGELKFRYQLTGAHGLPVEGKWYTSTFRNALIARIQDRSVFRDLQDLRQISVREGGDEIRRSGDDLIRYAGVAVQYFASVIVVDTDQEVKNVLSRARPTLETSVSKGRVASFSADRTKFVLAVPDRPDETFYLIDNKTRQEFIDRYDVGSRLAVTHYTDPSGAVVAIALGDAEQTQPLWVDDITVRVATEPIDLRSDPVVHKYLLYNGPVKVRLLGQMSGVEAVDPGLVSRYENDLGLNTLTDYPSQGFFGRVSGAIGWSWLIITCTNLMHWILWALRSVVWNYGLCIILLTVLVRLLIFPISRKQAATSLRMQALAPELKKLQEKHKDDRQALGVAQMELYRKHGVNPFGTCWFLLLQMPILMGLYFALQESIFFRLADFWPTWIINLAAPDMLFSWGESIPWISRPQDYGGFLYLGPYFNLLPVIAVALMIAQQKMLTPPPTDEQQEMQQKIMKYMMVFFGLMFYKVAAGLCVYFIASSAWGFAERKLLPKFKPVTDDASADSLLKKMLPASGAAANGGPSTAITPAPDGKVRKGKKKRPERGGKPGAVPAEAERAAEGSPIARLRKRVRDWWQEVLKQAEKKAR
jgi:YidC/Oxa1 family membrane protein insertase